MSDDGSFDFLERLELAEATPETFGMPDDPVTLQVVNRSRSLYSMAYLTTEEDALAPFASKRPCTEWPVQRPVTEPELGSLVRQSANESLQLSLFSEHPELFDQIQQSSSRWDPSAVGNATMDLLGAIVIELTDLRENHLVAAMVGLLRRDNAPVEQIGRHALVAFEVVLSLALAKSLTLWDAHELYLDRTRSIGFPSPG